MRTSTPPHTTSVRIGRSSVHEHGHSVPTAIGVAGIRTTGRRLTRQRTLIWDTLVDSQGAHISAADLARAIRAKDPTLHQATIYRTLDRLVNDGLVLRTDLGTERSYYELASEHRHHHVICTNCGRVIHIHDDAIAATIATVEATTGFRLNDDEFAFQGLCPDCSSI